MVRRRVLVLGATGFLGRNLVRAMNASSLYAPVCCSRDLDLRDPTMAAAALKSAGQVDYILHAADVGGDAAWSASHPATQLSANARMTLNVLEAWRDLQPQARLVGLGSLWAYPEKLPIAREHAYWDGRMHAPTEHYGLCKKLLGTGIQAMRREHGLRGTMLVLGTVYGPGDTSSRAVPSLIRRMRESPAKLEVWCAPNAVRDFIYVDDQVEGILRHLDADEELLNVSSGVHSQMGELVGLLASLMGYDGKVVFNASAETGVSYREVSMARANALSGWPDNYELHSLAAGLQKTLQG